MTEHHHSEDDFLLFQRLFANKKAGEGIRPGFVDPQFLLRHSGTWFNPLGSMLILTKKGAQALATQHEATTSDL
ncbi:MAG TPA: hypothetical protein VFM48_12310 [Aquabacterium sp.]|nr:hypothetical protein [Aquabacterium sp.]